MITSILQGGLGNTMFQFAMGLAQARRLGTNLALDDGVLNKRPYQLNEWPGAAAITRPSRFTNSTIQEKGMPYNQGIVDRIKDGDVLSGYWQTEKYFKNIREELLRAFAFHGYFYEHTPNKVAIHIRRGDYLVSPHKEYHGVLPLEYYKIAIQYMREKVSNPEFYIFTEDWDWAEENLYEPGVHMIKLGSAVGDMWRMSHCQHQIIANSSYSWWGAWLNQNPDKIVIAPEKWFDQAPEDPRDIVPDSWVKI
jgi:hypothetical protein